MDAADGLHAEYGRFDLMEQGAKIAGPRAMVRIPDAVESAESRRGVGLVDGGVGVEPGISLGDLAGIGRQLVRELRIEQAGVRRPLPWWTRPAMGRISRAWSELQVLVGPAPGRVELIVLPKQADAEGADAEVAKQLVVAESAGVAGEVHLVEVGVAYTVAGVLDAAPHLEGWCGVRREIACNG